MTRRTQIVELMRAELAELRFQIQSLEGAIAALEKGADDRPSAAAVAVVHSPIKGTNKQRVFAAVDTKFRAMSEIEALTGLDRRKIRNVFSDPSVRDQFEAKQIEPNRWAYRRKEAVEPISNGQ